MAGKQSKEKLHVPRPDFATEIRKTGFVLENRVAHTLKTAGWSVISNKYYVDDSEESVREIDLVAYKVGQSGNRKVFTTLIVSCKKTASNVWALLSRDIDLKAPNSDWWPLHSWTNDKALRFAIAQPGMARQYHEGVAKLGVSDALKPPEADIFAFQEMSRETGAPQNDKAIFSAITSLMKAQAYELAVLPERRKDPVVYQFNLLSVVDADLVRLHFSKDKIVEIETEAEQYVARYIIGRKETFSRVRFIKADAFDRLLTDYSRLHLANCHWLTTLHTSFYKDVMEDPQRVRVFIDEFRESVEWYLRFRAGQVSKADKPLTSLSLEWNPSGNQVNVTIGADAGVIVFLNGDAKAKRHVAGALKKLYQYEGPFGFAEDDFPF
jgi:hypothetical protein